MSALVVTGTDTGVGKSIACALLLAAVALRDPGRPRRYAKPYQTGSPPDDDAALVARLAGLGPDEVLPPVVRLRLPASPLEAARAEGVAPVLSRRLPDAPAGAALLVEGAGGLLVPLTPDATLADAFAAWGAPLVVVARTAVGTVNHTLLTLAEARRRGLAVGAVAFAGPPTPTVLESVARHGGLDPERVVVLPRLEAQTPEAVARAAREALRAPAFAALLDLWLGAPPAGGAPPAPPARAGRPSLVARDAASVWHPYTQHGLGLDPLPVVAAEGAHLVLADGRRVVDGISGWWTTLHGHGHPSIARAIHAQALRLDHVQFAGATHEPAVRLAERLLALAPPGLDRVFYSDDGSTAVEAALKMALAFHARRGEPWRTEFLALEEAYHGDTVGAMSVSADGPFVRDFASVRFRVGRVPAPVRGRPVPECVRALEEALARDGSRLAAVVVEPLLLGASGMLVYPEAYLRAVRDLATRHGVLLVADEVLTGFGRTGAVFACERAGVSPDLLCVSKALTGGTLPLAATLATASVHGAFLSDRVEDAFLHGHSYTANPVACAAALAALDLLDADALARASAIGDRLEAGLAPLRGRPGVREVRGIGLVRAVEVADASGRGYLAGAGRRMAKVALEHGVLLRPLGPVLYALLPLCATDEVCDQVARAMTAAVEAVLPA